MSDSEHLAPFFLACQVSVVFIKPQACIDKVMELAKAGLEAKELLSGKVAAPSKYFPPMQLSLASAAVLLEDSPPSLKSCLAFRKVLNPGVSKTSAPKSSVLAVGVCHG